MLADILVKILTCAGLFFSPAFIINKVFGRKVSNPGFWETVGGTISDELSWFIGVVFWGAVAIVYLSKKKRMHTDLEQTERSAQVPPVGEDAIDSGFANESAPRTAEATAICRPVEVEEPATAKGRELAQLKAELASLESAISSERELSKKAMEDINRLSGPQQVDKSSMAAFGYKLASNTIDELSRKLPAMEAERFRVMARIIELQGDAGYEP